MPDNQPPPAEQRHLAPGRSVMAPPDPKTPSGRPAANTPLAEDRHAARSAIEEKAAETKLPHAE